MSLLASLIFKFECILEETILEDISFLVYVSLFTLDSISERYYRFRGSMLSYIFGSISINYCQ